jgi:hypothetical protein
MSELSFFGVDAGAIIGLVAIMEGIKAIIKIIIKNENVLKKIKGFYPLIVFILGIGLGALITFADGFTWIKLVYRCFGYGGVSSLLYESILEKIQKAKK